MPALQLPANRRVHIIEITPTGRAGFHRSRDAAARFDAQLRAGFTHDELEALTNALTRLAANAQGR